MLILNHTLMLAGILKDIVNFTVELSLILYCSRIMISILYMHIYIYIGIVMIYVVRKITARLQMKTTFNHCTRKS